MPRDLSRYDPVWRAAEPYLRARKNDIHIPLSFAWCDRLLDQVAGADADVCLLAILLHDIGWWAIDMDTILAQGFRSPDPLHSDVRYRHEVEGVRLAGPVLAACGWDALAPQVLAIIDGHDTRDAPRSLNDRVVRDADKLWRYEPAAVAICTDWFQETPRQNLARSEALLPRFETEAGRAMATAELARTRAALMTHLI